MLYTLDNQETDWYNKIGYSIKEGTNYNIDQHHNVFFNTGVIRQPQFNALFPFNQNVYKDAKNERIFSIWLDYGFKFRYVDVNINAYRTQWDDRFITRTFDATVGDVGNFCHFQLGNSYFYSALNMGQLHQPFELDAKAIPLLSLNLEVCFLLVLGNTKELQASTSSNPK